MKLIALAFAILFSFNAQAFNGSCNANSASCSFKGDTLFANQSVNVGGTIFVMQGDGNFVIYKNGAAVWATSFAPQNDVGGFTGYTFNMPCSGCLAGFQTDGNLVLYRPAATGGYSPYWASNTSGPLASTYTLTSTSPYIEIDRDGQGFAWSTNGQHAMRAVGDLAQLDPMNWLTKSVCVDGADQLTQADPYGGCPAGTSIRKIRVGESLPYYNKDNFNSQWNNFPVKTAAGQTLVVDARQFGPNFDHVFRSQDQFDIYGVNINNDGWVSALNTRDGGGYNTTFFGPNCEVGGGWVLFPAQNFLAAGSTTLTIDGRYWQQAGQAFPGTCTKVNRTSAITTWSVLPNYAFGGVNGGPVKYMNTIQSVHGYEPNSASFNANGHIEVFYFTREYGLTKWEVWAPIQQNAAPDRNSCGAINTNVSYQGQNFTIIDCHDNSDTVAAGSNVQLPIWPVPNLNLLSHANFDLSGGYLPASNTQTNLWHRAGNSPAGNLINLSLSLSTIAADLKYGGVGVRYLKTNCGAGADGRCNGTGEFIYQDLPINQFVNGQTYAYGLSARSTSGVGTLEVGIQVLSAAGQVLWGTSTRQDVGVDAGSFPSPLESQSVFGASAFIRSRAAMSIPAGASRVRFFFSPITPQTFDILEAYVAPY